MALWKISVKSSGTVNGIRLEKGMFVEMHREQTQDQQLVRQQVRR